MRLRRVQSVAFAALTMGVGARAWGQANPVDYNHADAAIGYQSLPAKSPRSSETGTQLTDSLLLHAGVGAETGYDSNVFYANTNPQASPILRVLPYLELTNASRAGVAPDATYFDLSTALVYREYLSTDPSIRQERAFMPTAAGTLELNANQQLSVGFGESFSRVEDPPYASQIPSQGLGLIDRDTNQFQAHLRWAPGGGRLQSTVSYVNTIDIFENDNLSAANSMTHQGALDVAWRWLPKTAIFASLQQGYVSYFNPGKSSSYPLHALLGLRGLITERVQATVAAGYANGFYSVVAGPSGLRGNLTATADVVFRPTVLTTIGGGYRHDFQNAVLGNFYYLDAVYLNVGQSIAGRFGLGGSARYESRSYSGIPVTPAVPGGATRHDDYWQVGANLDYHFHSWSYAGLAYSLMANLSDWVQTNANNPPTPQYVKQLFFARVGVSY
jgi:hypothetical protein